MVTTGVKGATMGDEHYNMDCAGQPTLCIPCEGCLPAPNTSMKVDHLEKISSKIYICSTRTCLVSCGLLEQRLLALVTDRKSFRSGSARASVPMDEISMEILRSASDAARCMRKGCKTSVSECNHIIFLSMFIGGFLLFVWKCIWLQVHGAW